MTLLARNKGRKERMEYVPGVKKLQQHKVSNLMSDAAKSSNYEVWRVATLKRSKWSKKRLTFGFLILMPVGLKGYSFFTLPYIWKVTLLISAFKHSSDLAALDIVLPLAGTPYPCRPQSTDRSFRHQRERTTPVPNHQTSPLPNPMVEAQSHRHAHLGRLGSEQLEQSFRLLVQSFAKHFGNLLRHSWDGELGSGLE